MSIALGTRFFRFFFLVGTDHKINDRHETTRPTSGLAPEEMEHEQGVPEKFQPPVPLRAFL